MSNSGLPTTPNAFSQASDPLEGAYPLSFLQAGMLFHHVSHETGNVDIEQLSVSLEHPLDAKLLQKSLQALLERHPILKTRFQWQDSSKPQQQIVETCALPPVESLTQRNLLPPEKDRDRVLMEFLAADRQRGFDLAEAPFVRASLIDFADDDNRLVLTMHHAIVDGRSFPLLLTDLFAVYHAIESGQSLPNTPTYPKYEEYIQWLQTQDFEAQSREFWQKRLSGFEAATPLMVDDLPDAGGSQGSAWQDEVSLGKHGTAALEALADESGVTLNTVVQAAWSLLLAKYSGETDVVFGATRACRKSTPLDLQNAVGLFINTLPVRAEVTAEKELSILLRELRDQWVAMRPHEHTPLGLIQGWSDVGPGHSLFESIIVFESFDLDTHLKSLGSEWENRKVEVYEKTNFPLTLAAYHGSQLRLKIEFDDTVFSPATIRRMLGHLRHLLTQFGTGASATLGSFSLVGESENSELRKTFATPLVQSEASLPLHREFEKQVVKFPHRTAVSYAGANLSYAELNARANRIAHFLREAHSVCPETLVAFCLERSALVPAVILGILKAGGGYIPIDPVYPEERRNWILEDSQAQLLFTEDTHEEIAAHSFRTPDPEANPEGGATAENVAYVIFTSGSTGKPKGVLVTHHNVARLMTATKPWFQFDENDVWTLFHSFAFDFSVWEIWGPLLYGGELVVVPFDVTRSPDDFYQLLADQKVTILNQTPSAFTQLIAAENRRTHSAALALRYVVFGGEALELESLRPWFERHGSEAPQLINMYGITETTVHVTYRPLSYSDLQAGSVIGCPIPDLAIYIFDQQGNPVPIGVPGEIYVGGAGVARGYLNRPELTKERFLANPYHEGERLYRTGDVARFLPGGDIEYLGRCDDQVKIRGFRIELGEIGSVFNRHESVRTSAIVVREDTPGEKRIVAYVVTKSPITTTELRDHAATSLPQYMVPAALVFLDDLPLTNNGKVDRKALPLPTDEQRKVTTALAHPTTPTETALTKIWCQVLRITEIGRDENYFELGGDSISSIQVVSLARQQGFELKPRDLFDRPTIAELSEVADSRTSKVTTSIHAPIERASLTAIQSWFFGLTLPDRNHWNQAFLFEVAEPLDPNALDEALVALTAQHPALRTRFVSTGGHWEQSLCPPPQKGTILRTHTLSATPEEILKNCQAAQASLDITNGSLLRAVSFTNAGQTGHRLFLAVHHLAIDGVSWRILLEDLEALLLKKVPQATTAPFLAWPKATADLAQNESFQEQIPYWKKALRPFRIPASPADNTATNATTDTFSLSREETTALLSEAPGALRARIDELLLTALSDSLVSWTANPELVIDLEGHGRSDLIDLDVSRTIGWFTSMYPLAVDLTSCDTVFDRLRTVKETFRAVPDKGLGFGLLNQLESFPSQERSDVLFNYLGQIDQVTEGSRLFSFAKEDSGQWYAPDSTRPYLLEINIWVQNGQLEARWTYPQGAIDAKQIAQAGQAFTSTLRHLIETAKDGSKITQTFTPSDFPQARHLTQPDLDALIAGSPLPIEDIYGLTPLQNLYYTLETARAGSGLDQWHWQLAGQVDSDALLSAWQTTLNETPGLRSTFIGEGLLEPLQVIRQSPTVTIATLDWRDSNSSEQNKRLTQFLEEDKAAGLPVDEAPIMRLTHILLDEGRSHFVWTHHHLQIDGWSWPLILAKVSQAYAQAVDSGSSQPSATHGKTIRDYLRWRERWNGDAAVAFWKNELNGFSSPTPFPGTPVASTSYRELTQEICAPLTSSLTAFARSSASTLNSVIQAAWALLLSKQSGEEDIVFGASFSGRPAELPGVETIIGALVNNLPIRVPVLGEDTVATLITGVQERLVSAAEHQHLPLPELQSLSEIPLKDRLFDSLIVFQNYEVDADARRLGEHVTIEDFTAPVRTNYPLTLVIEPSPTIRLTAIYQDARFSETYASQLITELEGLLQKFVAQPDRRVSDLRKGLALETLPRIETSSAPRAMPSPLPATRLQRKIAEVWKDAFGLEAIGLDENFFDLGGNSLLLVQVHNQLRKAMQQPISVVAVFKSPTIRSLANALGEQTDAPIRQATPTKPAGQDGIAIIGMSGRFPGAESIDEFWQNLVAGIESIESFSDSDLAEHGIEPAVVDGAGHYVRRRGQIPNPEAFDAGFFEMTPKEAEATDPQQRLFLETAWAALEDAGYAPSRTEARTGVFAGMSNNTFYQQYVHHDDHLRAQLGDLSIMMANEKDYLATRTAYKLNLNGPALNIYTACSTSLVAVAEAVYALREGRCEMAVAGAISLTFPQCRGYYHEEGGITSPDGHCRPFDSQAAGTVFSNGMGAVILKPLAAALADGDTVHAVIRGAGLNNDGSDKVSFTAPSVRGQAGAIADAYQQADVPPESVSYIEAHGTGTTLGDPIEIEALTLAFRQGTAKKQFCKLGSVKSNIGHLDAAAGMAGLIKTTLALRNATIPGTLHYKTPNPKLRLEDSPFQVVETTQPWITPEGSPRRAGVSSFGVGGTNAHLLLEEAPEQPAGDPAPRSGALLCLSAKSPCALADRREQLACYLESNPSADLADVAYTLQVGREPFGHRFAVVATSLENAIELLRSDSPKCLKNPGHDDLPIAYLFPGQGAQSLGMGRGFYENEPVYRKAVDECAGVLQETIGEDIRKILYADADDIEAARKLGETRFTQPALFVTSYAGAKLLQSLGLAPSKMIGHSVGEYAAACIAGVLSLEDALRLIAKRAKLVQAQPPGSMLAVRLPEEEVRKLLPPELDIAALNSPKMTVVAGADEAIAAFEKQLQTENIAAKRLDTSHAFHSAMMEPVVAPFTELLKKTVFHVPEIPYVSNVTAAWITEDQAADPAYWAGHVRDAVRFADGVRTLADGEQAVLIEVGPGRSLATFAKQSLIGEAAQAVVESMPVSAQADALEVLAAVWLAGGAIDWAQHYHNQHRRRISLPTYPFQRKPHWPKSVRPELPLQARGAAIGSPAVKSTTVAAAAKPQPVIATQSLSRKESIATTLRNELHDLTGIEQSELVADASFLDLGFDSLFIGQAAMTLSKRFGTPITFRHMMDEHDSIAALASYLDETLPEDKFTSEPTANALAAPVADSGQIATSPEKSAPRFEAGTLHQNTGKPVAFGPFRPVEKAEDGNLTEVQKAHLENLIARYTERTFKSKTHTGTHRAHLADPRAAAGFSPLWKEMVYPIVTNKSDGAYLWDLDGQQWIDVTHGFGLGLLGHRPQCVVDAVHAQTDAGFEIGPSSPLAGEVAAMLCEISGRDRVSFCDTGSEAVTAAIRVARTVTQRPLIAAFAGAYHGIFDEVLGRPLVTNGELRTLPIAPGITNESLANILILEYGNPESLKFIESYADQLAAVLVEPVQSRRPHFQPREFLHQLRQTTQDHGIALVFDEVVTGFRCHPRGAQGLFEVEADLVTYGKVLGGGLPIGAIAGSKEYMDALDGGAWSYGDDSGPTASVTFFAGTFVRHPLALAAAKAVLTTLTEGAGKLQKDLDARTATMVAEMNTICATAGVPALVTRFSSMYFFNFAPELKFAPLFFYHMRLRGIHTWDTRPSFLSLVHTEEDIAAIIQAFRESIEALQDGGFFPRASIQETPPSFPLTDGQQEILLASKMSADANRAFNESVTIKISHAPETATLEAAIRRLNARHESLRTVFASDGSSQTVIANPEFEPRITQVDFSNKPDATARMVHRDDAIRTLFDLHQGPLARFDLITTESGESELLIVAHHSICDGWSFDVLFRDFADGLRELTGLLGEATPLPVPFRKFAEAANPTLQKSSLDYWTAQLKNPPTALRLPSESSPTTKGKQNGGSHTTVLPAALAEKLETFSRSHKTTPYVVLLASFRELLARLSGQDDFIIGTPVAGQATVDLPGITGHGVQFLPTRFRRDLAVGVDGLVSETKAIIYDAMEHQHCTLQSILPHLKGDATRIGRITTTFTLEAPSHPEQVGETELALAVNPKLLTNFDLGLFIVGGNGNYALTCNYRSALFSPETIQDWMETYLALTEQLLTAEDHAPASGITALGAAQRTLLLDTWNAPAKTDLTAGKSVLPFFAKQVLETPGATAITSAGGALSYEALDTSSTLLAKRLLDHGITQGDFVGIFAERSPEAIVAILAILKVGAAYVPIDATYPSERIQWIIEDSATKVILTQASLKRARKKLKSVTWLDIDGCCKNTASADLTLPDLNSSGEDVAYVMYTSGSTGKPKGVIVPHRGITRLVVEPNFMEIRPDDIFLQFAPITFDAATLEIWGPLLNGATLAIPDEGTLSLTELGKAISRFQVTNLWLTAGLFQVMIDEHPEALRPIKQLLTGGDVLPVAHIRKALTALPETHLINGYGPTENTTFTCCHPITADDTESAIPIGRPINGTEVYILDPQNNPQPIGVPGELFIGGTGLATGYLNDTELTAAKFVPHPFRPGALLYRSGDLCRYRRDGVIEFIGRMDTQLKIRGFRVEPGEIETALATHPAVRQAAVTTTGEDAGDRQLAAYAVGDASPEELRKWLKERLPSYLVPSTIQLIDALPVTTNGKTDYRALTSQHTPRTQVNASAPLSTATATEKKLGKLWQSVLGRNSFGTSDSFFEIGGTSLLGLKLFTRIEKEFGHTLPLATLFKAPTIRELAAYLDGGETTPSCIAPISEGGSGTPLFCVHGGGGGILFYKPMADALQSKHPVFGIESPHLTAGQLPPEESVEKTAARYLDELRAIRPEGPYILAGYSFGGVIAYEMAQQLIAAGDTVEALILFDTSNPAIPPVSLGATERLATHWSAQDKRPLPNRLAKLGRRVRSGFFNHVRTKSEVAAAKALSEAGIAADEKLRPVQVREIYERAMDAYRPTNYPGTLTLFIAEDPGDKFRFTDELGWETLITGGITRITTPGDHLTIFDSENAPALSLAIASHLESEHLAQK